MLDTKRFDGIICALPEAIKRPLSALTYDIKAAATEIRLRAGCPLSITVMGRVMFVSGCGEALPNFTDNAVAVTARDINDSFRFLCNNSAFSREEELREGYIALKNGCRAGVCGTLTKNGFMRDITAINIRIAREIKGCADSIATAYSGGGLLLAGPPCSGKTTILRELLRKLSSGECGRFYRISVIDSRQEISGGGSCDLGPCCDVLVTENKAKGCEIALRTMFPDIIAFDEIGTLDELNEVKNSFFSGVSIITTAHAGSTAELLERSITRTLIESGAIAQIALIPSVIGGKVSILSVKELLYEAYS